MNRRQGTPPARATPGKDEEQHSFASIVKTQNLASRGHSGLNSPRIEEEKPGHRAQVSIDKVEGDDVDASLRAYANELAIDAAIEESKSRRNSVDLSPYANGRERPKSATGVND